MSNQLHDRVEVQRRRLQALNAVKSHTEATILDASQRMTNLLAKQDVCERTKVALQQCKPLLSASSIKECEALANQALITIFQVDWKVRWDAESSRFVLDKGDGFITDLTTGEGGGMATVISFVFQLFILVKLQKRRFLIFDEAFYAVSAQYFNQFVAFVRQVTKDLGVDLLLVSHDARISEEDVDHIYQLSKGVTKRLK